MNNKPKEKYSKTEDNKFKIVREMETVIDAVQLVTLREQHIKMIETMKDNIVKKEQEIKAQTVNLEHIKVLIETAKGLGIDFTEAEEKLKQIKKDLEKK